MLFAIFINFIHEMTGFPIKGGANPLHPLPLDPPQILLDNMAKQRTKCLNLMYCNKYEAIMFFFPLNDYTHVLLYGGCKIWGF